MLDNPFLGEKLKCVRQNTSYFEENPAELLDNEQYVKNTVRIWSDSMKKQKKWIEEVRSNFEKIRIHTIKYEDSLLNIDKEKSKLYKFLALDPKERNELKPMDFPGFVRDKQANNLSHFRKGIAGDWKNYFTKDVCEWVKEVAGDTLIDMGYEKNLDWDSSI